MVTHCCTSLKVKIGDIVFGLSCLCGLNWLGLSAFIYFGQVIKWDDAFGPLFLCPSNVVTPVFRHESTPHLLLDTNSVYIIHFMLVGELVCSTDCKQTRNTVGKGCDADVSCHPFGRALFDVPKKQLQRKRLDHFLLLFTSDSRIPAKLTDKCFGLHSPGIFFSGIQINFSSSFPCCCNIPDITFGYLTLHKSISGSLPDHKNFLYQQSLRQSSSFSWTDSLINWCSWTENLWWMNNFLQCKKQILQCKKQ